MPASEANFDGLVGQTHSYAGLSPGNLASAANTGAVANPRMAARQGLEKMRAVRDMGFAQGVIPPLERPDIGFLRSLGFAGDDAQVMRRAARESPDMLAAACAASSMWTANAATVSPSADTADGRVHFTPANLISNLHRAIEAPTTTRLLRAIFPDESRFAVHDPLPGAPTLGDEGAANHTRLCAEYGEPGVEFFVYGRAAEWDHDPERRLGLGPKLHPARQTREASEAIVRRHGLAPERVVYAQQNPAVIDAGVFHNDVISVGNRDFFFHHEDAFVDTPHVVGELRARLAEVCGGDLVAVCVPASAVSVEEAVRTYLFNSQLLSVGDGGGGGMTLVAPEECLESKPVSACLDELVSGDGPIREVRHFDLRQSMRNGGGPACLRLRVVLGDDELAATNPGALLTDQLYKTLDGWIERHYREELLPADLADPALVGESREALDELTRIMGLGDIYAFQRG